VKPTFAKNRILATAENPEIKRALNLITTSCVKSHASDQILGVA